MKLKKSFLTVRMVRQWNKLPREGIESSSLEVLKKSLNRHFWNYLGISPPAFGQRIELNDLEVSFDPIIP